MRIIYLRQLSGVLFATVVTLLPLTRADAAPDKAEQVGNELEAARLMESQLASGSATTAEKWDKLEETYRALQAKHPRDPKVLNAYASFLWQRGRMDRAEAQWREAAKLDPNGAETLAGLGAAAVARGEVREAANCFTRASASAPENPRLHFDLANVLYLFRHDLLDAALPDSDAVIARAMKHYDEACRLAPRNVDFARGYAETFYGLPKPNWEGALVAWQHLLDISPQQDFALANLATVHLRLGDKDSARACVAKMMSPEFAVRKARIADRIERE
jgi:tetratricopeptide (TPR) repeat protein